MVLLGASRGRLSYTARCVKETMVLTGNSDAFGSCSWISEKRLPILVPSFCFPCLHHRAG